MRDMNQHLIRPLRFQPLLYPFWGWYQETEWQACESVHCVNRACVLLSAMLRMQLGTMRRLALGVCIIGCVWTLLLVNLMMSSSSSSEHSNEQLKVSGHVICPLLWFPWWPSFVFCRRKFWAWAKSMCERWLRIRVILWMVPTLGGWLDMVSSQFVKAHDMTIMNCEIGIFSCTWFCH